MSTHTISNRLFAVELSLSQAIQIHLIFNSSMEICYFSIKKNFIQFLAINSEKEMNRMSLYFLCYYNGTLE